MYEKDIYHWASSSTQESTCTVEPGTVEDVAKIVHLILVILRNQLITLLQLQIMGQMRVPFGVRRFTCFIPLNIYVPLDRSRAVVMHRIIISPHLRVY
jgi:hypothetical protein